MLPNSRYLSRHYNKQHQYSFQHFLAQLQFEHCWNWHIKLLYILMHQPIIHSTQWGSHQPTIFGNLLKQTISSSFSCIVYQIFSLCVCPGQFDSCPSFQNLTWANPYKEKWKFIQIPINIDRYFLNLIFNYRYFLIRRRFINDK